MRCARVRVCCRASNYWRLSPVREVSAYAGSLDIGVTADRTFAERCSTIRLHLLTIQWPDEGGWGGVGRRPLSKGGHEQSWLSEPVERKLSHSQSLLVTLWDDSRTTL